MCLKYTVRAVGSVLLLVGFGANAQQYAVTNLGTLGGSISGTAPYSTGAGINASGQVTGSSVSSESSNPVHAFITIATTNAMTDLGSLLPGGGSAGSAINASGQVTGNSQSDEGDFPIHAFVTSAATNAMIDLGTLACGTNDCNGSGYGTAINASGQVAGYSSIATSVYTYHAFVTNATTNAMIDLGTLAGNDYESEGYGINASGQVTGWTSIAGSGFVHAFITNATTNAMTDLGTLGGNSKGYGINDRGQVTGQSGGHVFLYSSGRMHDLGTLGGAISQGNSINASGQVTGWSDTSGNIQHAFLYRNSQMVDLNSEIGGAAALYTLSSGQGINDTGQMVVNGMVNATGEDVAFLLTPTAISTSTGLTPSASASTYGSAVTLAAVVTPIGGRTPSGKVSFYADADFLGKVSIDDGGQAVLTTSALGVGVRSLTATYNGNSTDLASTSSASVVTISAVSTATTLIASPTTGAPGTAVTFTATVTPISGTASPKGKVTFKDGTTTLAAVQLAESGVATYTGALMNAGTHTITAHYDGSADEVKSVSVAVKVTIT